MKKILAVLALILACQVRTYAQITIPEAKASVAAPTYVEGKYNPLSTDLTGALRVTFSGSAGNGAAGPTSAAVPTQADYLGANVGGNLVGLTATGTSLNVNITGGSSGNGAASNTGAAVPAQGDYCGVNVAGTLRGCTGVNPSGSVYAMQVDLTSANGVTLLMGNGVTGTGSPRVTVSSDNTPIPTKNYYGDGTTPILSTDIVPVTASSATVPVVTMNSASANSGVNSAMAAVFDDVGPTSITENSFGFVRMSANRNMYHVIRDAAGNERGANVNASSQLSVSVDNTVTVGSHAVTNAGTFAVQATLQAAATTVVGEVIPMASATTTDAALGCYVQSGVGTTASTNATSCKGSAGNFYGFRAINTTGTLAYLRMYNASSGPTCSSATGFIESIPIPANTAGAGAIDTSTIPIGYTTGIGFCVTGGSGNTDNTNAPAGVFITVKYK